MLCIVEEREGKVKGHVARGRVVPEFSGPAGRGVNIPLSCLVDVLLFDRTWLKCSVMDTDYILHRILRRIASWATYSFFTEVRVIGGENVPMNGPIIV